MSGGMGEEVSRLRSTNRELKNSHGDMKEMEQPQILFLRPIDMNNGGGLPEDCDVLGGRGQRGKSRQL